MIRSIAYELFGRLTTDPEALRKQVAEARRDRDAVEAELLDYKCGAKAFACNQCKKELEAVRLEFSDYRDRLQTIVDEEIEPHPTMKFAKLLDAVEQALSKGSRAEAQLLLQRDKSDLTIEPTWILAAWSVSGSEWAEVKRGSYDAMLADMRRDATSWNLFSRSTWDALVKNGRAR